ncbi:hypothetical protein LARI1_G002067 [Lachnellula arida]|uniref:Uncharacterized protein n=1 Tax=Lachnellula arida TaxID=1316785 RepID=A0A8T9BME4_9HELO|nr:hypothetical protein LARI1_G002067 [Lachnellula arida]
MRAVVGGVYGTRRNTSTLNQDSNNQNQQSKSNTTNSTPTPTPTPTRLRPTKLSHRTPLRSRDQNAMMRAQKGVTPLTVKSGNGNMPPYDKQNASRPLMPTLSATVKPPARQPLTPRVAGAASPALSTPLSRRPLRLESNTTPSREEISTPVSTFLNSNITPRSGSRKNRVDSANTTPTGTPNGTPAPPLTNESTRFQDAPLYGSALGIAGMDKEGTKRHTVSFNTPSDIGARSPALSSGDSKFFFASDAKSTPPPPQRPPIQSKTSTFFYASGENIPQQPQSSSASAVGSTVGEERVQPKFFHANGTPDLQLSPSPHFPPPRPSSAVSNSTRMTSPRLATASPGTLSPPQSRPLSPTKPNQHVSSVPSLRNTPSLPSPGLPRPQQVGRGQSATNIVSPRRQSIEVGQRVVSHGRSTSTGSTGPTPRKVSGGSSVEPTTPLNMVATSVPVSTPEEGPEQKSNDNVSELQSPIKVGQTLDQLNELAADARRERKVMDLEITNSSLEAINRTLEREMRKQTAELRRYRRLSRSGRLSIATSASMRTSTTLSMDGIEGIEGDPLSDMSEEEEDEEDLEIEESSDSESSLSPAAMAESDLRHRKKDEKRLQLDLTNTSNYSSIVKR